MVDVIVKLKAWRIANRLSQRAAAEVMNARDFPIKLTTLQRWEIYNRRPEKFAARALETFLTQYPTIADPPKYGRWRDKITDEQIGEILKLRQQGLTLLAIAQRYGLVESAVSRICSGKRSGKARGRARRRQPKRAQEGLKPYIVGH